MKRVLPIVFQLGIQILLAASQIVRMQSSLRSGAIEDQKSQNTVYTDFSNAIFKCNEANSTISIRIILSEGFYLFPSLISEESIKINGECYIEGPLESSPMGNSNKKVGLIIENSQIEIGKDSSLAIRNLELILKNDRKLGIISAIILSQRGSSLLLENLWLCFGPAKENNNNLIFSAPQTKNVTLQNIMVKASESTPATFSKPFLVSNNSLLVSVKNITVRDCLFDDPGSFLMIIQSKFVLEKFTFCNNIIRGSAGYLFSVINSLSSETLVADCLFEGNLQVGDPSHSLFMDLNSGSGFINMYKIVAKKNQNLSTLIRISQASNLCIEELLVESNNEIRNGLEVSSSLNITLDRCFFISNSAAASLVFLKGNPTCLLQNSIFVSSFVGSSAVFIDDSINITVKQFNILETNKKENTSYLSSNSALCVNLGVQSIVSISGSTFFLNSILSLMFSGKKARVSIETTYFINNTSLLPTEPGCLLHYAELIDMIITKSKFSNNFVVGSGSICIDFTSNGSLTIVSSFFGGNQLVSNVLMSDNVGAVRMNGQSLVVSFCLFEGNNATCGSSIFLSNTEDFAFQSFLISNSTFKNNVADMAPIIFFEKTLGEFEFLFSNSLVSSSFAYTYPAFTTFFWIAEKVSVTFRNSTFFNNTSLFYGGVFGLFHYVADFVLEKCEFIENGIPRKTTGSTGGVIYMAATFKTVIKTNSSKFIRNQVYFDGGAIAIITGILKDFGSVFESNNASSGGALFLYSSSLLELEGTLIIRCQALVGGGIKLAGNVPSSLKSVVIESCSADNGAGIAIDSSEAPLNIFQGNFFRNKAINGAFITATASDAIMISESNFEGNTATNSIFNLLHSRALLLNIIISDNKGRLLYLGASDINLKNLEFEFSVCGAFQEGCFSLLEDSSNMHAYGLRIKYINTTEHSLFLIIKSTFNVKSSIINDIRSKSDPSIIYAQKGSLVTVNSTDFKDIQRTFLLSVKSDLIVVNSHFAQMPGTLRTISKDEVEAGKFIRCEDCPQVVLKGNEFFGGKAREAGGAVLIRRNVNISIEDDKKCIISSNAFLCNSAKHGGAINIVSEWAEITDNYFFNNSAEEGGGLFISCGEPTPSTISFERNNFSNNYAIKGGGAAKLSNKLNLLTEKDNSFSNNSALYGDNLAGCPDHLAVENYLEASTILNHFKSGGELPKPINVNLMDQYNNSITIDQSGESTVEIIMEKLNESDETKAFSVGGTTSYFSDGVFSFSKISFLGKPERIFFLRFSSNLINKTYFASYQGKFRKCIQGEIFNAFTNTCDECPAGSFSFDANDTSCYLCPENAICQGGNYFNISDGFWRSSAASHNILKCSKASLNCLGGIEASDKSCRNGHKGPLCRQCASSPTSSYFRNSDGYCIECANIKTHLIGLIFITILMILYYEYTIWRNIRAKSQGQDTIRIRQLTDYIHICSVLFNLQINWPDAVKEYIGGQSMASGGFDLVFFFDCIAEELKETLSIFTLRILTMTGFFIFWALVQSVLIVLLIKEQEHSGKRKRIMNAFIILCFLLQPLMINTYIEAFNCFQVEGVSYLEADPDFECYTSEHLAISIGVSLPMLLLWIFFYPGLIYLYYKRKYRALTKEVFLAKIKKGQSFLFTGFVEDSYAWIFYIMFRKTILIVVTTTIKDNQNTALLYVIIILTIAMILQLVRNPFVETQMNHIEFFSLFACFLMYFCGLYYTRDQNEEKTVALVYICITANLCFFLYMVFSILQIYYNNYHAGLVSTYRSIRSRLTEIVKSPRSRKSSKRQSRNTENYSSAIKLHLEKTCVKAPGHRSASLK